MLYNIYWISTKMLTGPLEGHNIEFPAYSRINNPDGSGYHLNETYRDLQGNLRQVTRILGVRTNIKREKLTLELARTRDLYTNPETENNRFHSM